MSKTAIVLVMIGFVVVGAVGFLLGGGHADLDRATKVGNALAFLSNLATAGALVVGFQSLAFQQKTVEGQERDVALQRAELAMQRQEMSLQRNELAKTAEAQQELAEATLAAVEAQKIANSRSLALMLTQQQLGLAWVDITLAQDPPARTDQDLRRHETLENVQKRLRSAVIKLELVIQRGEEKYAP